MKTIVKIEIVLLALVVLTAVGMVLVSEGVLGLFYEPVIREPEVAAIPTDAPPAETEAPVQPEPEAPKEIDRVITATRYFAYDLREETYLKIQGEPDERIYPASITKLLTAYVALQYMDPQETVTVTEAILELVEEDSSTAGLEAGDQLTVEQLIGAMMLPSGNDAAQTIAVAAGRVIAQDSGIGTNRAVNIFVEEMNKQAQALGMENSHFNNPDGFHHDDHYTTMNDLVKLCRVVLADASILKYTSLVEATVELPDKTLEWVNTNALLHAQSESYLPNTIGLKTGYTEKAGNCLISAFFMEDRMWIIGVFGCPTFTEDRYLDTVAIYNSI